MRIDALASHNHKVDGYSRPRPRRVNIRDITYKHKTDSTITQRAIKVEPRSTSKPPPTHKPRNPYIHTPTHQPTNKSSPASSRTSIARRCHSTSNFISSAQCIVHSPYEPCRLSRRLLITPDSFWHFRQSHFP